MVLCPYCAESINKDAVKCKHCGEFLSADDLKKNKGKSYKKSRNRLLKIVVGGLFVLGFLVKSALNSYENEAIEYNNLGFDDYENGQYEKALINFDKALSIDPELAMTHSNKCLLLLDAGEFVLAKESCERALELDPDLPEALNNMCIVFDALGDHVEALGYCNKALEIDPDAISYSNKCLVLVNMTEYTDALEYCNKALALDSSLPEARSNKGFIVSEYDAEESLKYYDRSLELSPSGVTAYNKALSLIELEEYGAAIETVSNIDSNDPYYKKLSAVLCYANFGIENYEIALSHAQNYLANNDIDEDYESVLFCRGMTEYFLLDTEGSEKTMNEILKINPNNDLAIEWKNLF